MIFKNSKLFLVVLSLILALLVALVAFAIYDIKTKNNETSILLNEADRITEARSLSQSIRIAQNNAAEDLADFDKLLLSDDKLVSLIEKIERTGRALSLETSIVSVDKNEDQSSGPNIIRIVMETQGSWASNLSFLRAIESLPQRVLINESNLSKGETGWHLRIALSLYSFN